ncbi:MAG: hypothetical protein V2A77_11360 [Pseudomonadota bacterium]
MPSAGRLIETSSYSPNDKAMLEMQLAHARIPLSPECLTSLTADCLDRGVPAQHLGEFFRVLSRVGSIGLPVSVFHNKIAEGLAKDVPSSVILKVLQDKELNYLTARQILIAHLSRRMTSDPAFFRVLDLTAEGLRRGLPAEGLRRIFFGRDRSLDEMDGAVRAWLHLQAIRFPYDQGLDIIMVALESGQFRQCRNCLGQVVFTARCSGTSPTKIREEMIRGMRSGRNLGEISRVLCSASTRPAR